MMVGETLASQDLSMGKWEAKREWRGLRRHWGVFSLVFYVFSNI